ncbi:MAG: hypothetical protein IKV36_04735 [Clostridia bacterium]|nr:hypothetical protein [Clostridia bacterium]
MSTFSKIFLSVVAAFLVLLVVSSFVLAAAMKDYESNLPQSMAQVYFEEQVKTGKLYGIGGTEFESKVNVVNAFTDKYKSENMTLFTVTSSENDVYKYIVKSGDEKVLTMTIVANGKESKFGFPTHIIEKIDLHFGNSIILRAPADCIVQVNGVKLEEKHRTSQSAEDIALPEGIEAVPIYTYKINNLFKEPDIVAKDQNGNNLQVVYNETSKEYEVLQNQDEQLKENYGYLARTVVRTYATYMQNDCKFGDIAKYLQKGTNTYNYIKTSEVGWVWAHEGFDFSDEWCGEFKKINENVFTCRVKMTQTLHLTDKQPYKDYIDVTLCFNKQASGTYLVYSLKGNR